MQAVLLIAAIVVFIALSGFIFMWIYVWGIAKKQYSEMFIRTSPDKWARGNSCPENEEHSVMFNAGMKWGEENASYKEDIEITSKDGIICALWFAVFAVVLQVFLQAFSYILSSTHTKTWFRFFHMLWSMVWCFLLSAYSTWGLPVSLGKQVVMYSART